jgi:hypothetical protein
MEARGFRVGGPVHHRGHQNNTAPLSRAAAAHLSGESERRRKTAAAAFVNGGPASRQSRGGQAARSLSQQLAAGAGRRARESRRADDEGRHFCSGVPTAESTKDKTKVPPHPCCLRSLRVYVCVWMDGTTLLLPTHPSRHPQSRLCTPRVSSRRTPHFSLSLRQAANRNVRPATSAPDSPR